MPKPSTHGGARPGAGRKPTLRPLHVVRLLDATVREALAALTAHEREASGNPSLSQEQVVARLIRSAHEHMEVPATANLDLYDNQVEPANPSPIASPPRIDVHAIQDDITSTSQRLRRQLQAVWTKASLGKRDGLALLDATDALLDRYTRIALWRSICEELERTAPDDPIVPARIATLVDIAHQAARIETWRAVLDRTRRALMTRPLRQIVEREALFDAVQAVADAAPLAANGLALSAGRLAARGIDPAPWIAQAQRDLDYRKNQPAAAATAGQDSGHEPATQDPHARRLPTAPAAAIEKPRPAPPPRGPSSGAAPLDEITGVRFPNGKSHDLGAIGKTRCGQYLPSDLDDVTWIRDPLFLPTCRRCHALRLPSLVR